MKKIHNIAPPVVMTTTRTPLTGALSVTADGGSLTQVYDVITSRYQPEDRTETPLVLRPVLTMVDPDTEQNVEVADLNVKWYITDPDNPITSHDPSDEYNLETVSTDDGEKLTGRLVVRHNVGPTDNYAVVIHCEVTFIHPERNEVYKYNADVMLTSENLAHDVLDIKLNNPSVVGYDPIRDSSSMRQFKAVAYNGAEAIDPANVKFFWYLDGTLAGSSKACYVSGQHTDTLTLDAEYADDVLVTVRMATDTTASEPDQPARAESTLLWKWPRLKAIPYSQGGETVNRAGQQVRFGAIVQANGKDISSEKRNRYIRLRWYSQPTDTMTRKDQGWGYEKTIQGSDIYRTSGVKVNVGVDLYTVGALPSVGGSGTQEIVANPAPPVVMTTRRSPLTGALFVSGGGASLSQVYNALTNKYEPEDRQETPLVLTPVLTLTDPETKAVVPLSQMSAIDVKWYLGNSDTPVISRVASADYYLTRKDGMVIDSLAVRHNVGPTDNYSVTIRCEVEATDNSRNEKYRFQALTMLTSENKAQNIISVQLKNPSLVGYDPIRDDSSLRQFKAVAYKGAEVMAPESVKFFWYLDGELLSDSVTLGYVSGQYTDTLTLDAEYIDNALVEVRLSIDTTLSVPNHPARAQSTLMWKWPALKALPYSMSGEAIRSAGEMKRFGCIVQANGKDVPQEKVERYFRMNWFTQPSDTMVRKEQGWGPEIIVPGSDLFSRTGASVNVTVDLYTVGHLVTVMCDGKMVVDSNGKAVVCGV